MHSYTSVYPSLLLIGAGSACVSRGFRSCVGHLARGRVKGLRRLGGGAVLVSHSAKWVGMVVEQLGSRTLTC